MEAHELVEKFKNNTKTEASYQEIVEWCSENASKLNLSNKEQQYLFEMSTRYLMKIKIGHWNEADANLIINYFAKTYANSQGIETDMVVRILQDPEYREKFKDNSNATCISHGDGKSEVVYSSRVVDNLTSPDTLRFIRGLQTVFHEVEHSRQYSEIYSTDKDNMQYDGNSYKIALEVIMRKVHPKFYKENYRNLIMEYQAEYVGLEQAIKMMQTYYNPDLFKGQDIDEFLNEMLMIDGKESYENLGEVSFDQRNINASALISFAADQYIQMSPEIISRIPVLKFAYNPDGSKKDITQLIQDRATLISSNPEMDLETIDDLYKTIANYKSITKDEMLGLYSYITDEGIEDKFAYDLLQYRLERTNWSQEKISSFMQQTRQDVARIRQERELIPEQEEGIRDEIGDEFKPQTQAQEQDEQQATTEWMHRIGTVAQDVDKTNAGVNGKQEVAKLIKDLDRKKQKDLGKEQEDEKQNF